MYKRLRADGISPHDGYVNPHFKWNRPLWSSKSAARWTQMSFIQL